MALNSCGPSANVVVGVRLQLPSGLTVVVPSTVVPSSTRIVSPATPVPTMVGVVSSVFAPVGTVPLYGADVVGHGGDTGASGAVASITRP